MNIEDELRAALRREPAPADFAARILSKTHLARTGPARWTLAVAAALALAALVPPAVHEYRQERALAARDQLIEALSITSVQLQQAKEKIRRNMRHPI